MPLANFSNRRVAWMARSPIVSANPIILAARREGDGDRAVTLPSRAARVHLSDLLQAVGGDLLRRRAGQRALLPDRLAVPAARIGFD
ncbi:MAG: hypothetical protein AAF676_12810, partial [Pseudomonadota bacterium]